MPKNNRKNEIVDSGLTSFELSALENKYSLSDGHAYHEMPKFYQPIINNISEIWSETESYSSFEVNELFKMSLANLINSKYLSGYKHYSICPTASNSIDIVATWLACKNVSVGLIEPAFDNLFLLMNRKQVDVNPLCESDFLDLEKLDFKVKEHSIGCIFLVSPNNPTGFKLSADEFSDLAKFCSNRGIVLVVDVTFRFYGDDRYDEYEILIENETKFIVIEDTGKTWPTLDSKVSLMAYSIDLAHELRVLWEEIYLCHSLFTINLLRYFLDKTAILGVDNAIQNEVDSRRNMFIEKINISNGFDLSAGGESNLPMIWLDCSRTRLDDISIVNEFNKIDVGVLPGRYFYWSDHEKCKDHVRISLLRPMLTLKKGVESIDKIDSLLFNKNQELVCVEN